MGLLGIPNGGSFFFAPDPARAIAFDGLAFNVLRSLQFSYMLMKGLRSTSRAFRDLEVFRNEGEGSRTGDGRCRWPSDRLGRIGTAATGSNRRRAGRQFSGGRCRGGGVRNGRGGTGRRARCAGGDKFGARGEGNLEGKVGTNGAAGGNNSECQGRSSKWTEGGNNYGSSPGKNGECKGSSSKWNGGSTAGKNNSAEGRGWSQGPRGAGNGDGKVGGELNTAGDRLNAQNPLNPQGAASPAGGGMAMGKSSFPADSAVVSKLNDGRINRTLAAAGAGAVDSISNQLKPMKGFVKSVKMATGVVSGVKTATGVIQKFQAPVGGLLIGFGAANGIVLGFETARMIVKVGKISKDFASVWKYTRIQMGVVSSTAAAPAAKAGRQTLLKGLKASDGALTLVKLFGGALGGTLQDGFSDWDLVTKCYDASNSVLKVFEAVLGLKGGGLIGVVGKGFTVLKGAVGGLGVSVKLVKVVVISKDISIFLLRGFGLSKTATEAFKASQEGKKMIKWLIFRDGSKILVVEDSLNTKSTASLNGSAADARTVELLMTSLQQSAARPGTSPSLMSSLASLLLARFETLDLGDPNEDGFSSSNMFPSGIFSFSLSLPSYPESEENCEAFPT